MQDSSTERVGRYQLLEPIGGGPNGSVARANVFGVAGFERQFAIKRFLPELTALPAAAQALSAAARAYGSLEHPRIARMSEFGVAQGHTFTAVELVAGLDVMRVLAESKIGGTAISSGGALALISQAARAVGYAHGRGLSHLGLSPTNVIVTSDGDVKVTDFGILSATITSDPVEAPRLAQRIGYLAPEQLAGEATSAATDVFALGVIAYELVTGQRAFFGDTPQAVARAILAGPPAEPALPRPIVRVLARCLARSQFERFPDARAFADALDAALRVAPVPGTRKEIGAQVRATLDRHAAMHEGELSGLVALNLTPTTAPARPRTTDLESFDAPEVVSTTEFKRPDLGAVGGPGGSAGPALPALTSTRPGLPVRVAPPIPSRPPLAPTQPMTVLGPPGAGKKAMIPSIAPVPPGKPVPRAQPPTGPGASAAPRAPSLPAGKPSGTVPNLRQTTPGSGPPPLREPDRKVPGSGASPVAPVPPASAGDPARRAPVQRASGLVRPISEAEVATLPGDNEQLNEQLNELVLAASDFSGVTDEQTRPGSYVRAESDFSDLAADLSVPSLAPPPTTAAGPRVRVEREVMPRTLDDPPTARHDVAPEVHARGGLMPFVQREAFAPEPTMTSPSIEIIDESATPGDLSGRGEPPLTSPPYQREMETSQMPPGLVQDLRRASIDEDPLVALQVEAHTRGAVAGAPDVSGLDAEALRGDPEPPPEPGQQSGPHAGATLFGIGPASDRAAARATTPVPGTLQGTPPPPRSHSRPDLALASQAALPRPARWPLVLGALVVLGAGGAIAAWRLQPSNVAPPRPRAVGAVPGDAAAPANPRSAVAAGSGAGSAAGSGAGSAAGRAAGSNVAVAAGHTEGSGAGSGAAPVAAPTASSDMLAIATTPGGARVFIDGADHGVTPVKLPGSADRHTMALMLPGHELYVAEVDGHGGFDISLKPVTPSGGRAGIKVIKCKDKARYYIFVDGKPTGMTCPSERIDTTVGPHTVEVYDIVTATRRKWDVNVADERLSFRVRVE